METEAAQYHRLQSGQSAGVFKDRMGGRIFMSFTACAKEMVLSICELRTERVTNKIHVRISDLPLYSVAPLE